MNAETMFQTLQNSKGQMMRGAIHTKVKTLKGVSAIVEKCTKGFFTCGTDYASKKAVIAAIENKERGEVGPLPWGHWRENRAPFIVDHTPKGEVNSIEYFRLYPPTPKQMEIFNLKFVVQFYENGKEITRERAIELCGSVAKARDEVPDCFTVRVENIALLGELDLTQGVEMGDRAEVPELIKQAAGVMV